LILAKLLRFIRWRCALQKQKFGSQQATAFCSIGCSELRLCKRGKVSEYLDTSAIDCEAILLCSCALGVLTLFALLEQLLGCRDGLLVWREIQRALLCIDDQPRILVYGQNVIAQRHQSRHSHRGSKQCDVRCRAASGQTDRTQSFRIERD
jgi:hypothetical protein